MYTESRPRSWSKYLRVSSICKDQVDIIPHTVITGIQLGAAHMPLSDRLVRLHWVKSELIICFKLPRQALWCLCFMSPCAFKECRELVETCQGEGDVDHIGWIWPCHSLKHGSSIWMASEVGMCLWKPIANSGRICLAFLCGQSLLFVTVKWMSPACYLIVRDNDTLWLMEYDVVFRILIMNRWVCSLH